MSDVTNAKSNAIMNEKIDEKDNEINSARSRVYQLLSALFAKEIDPQLRDELNGQPAQEFLQQLATEPQFSAEVKTIQRTLAGLQTEDDLLELAADYCGLFLVGSKQSASPYASLYSDEAKPTIFGQQHQQMTIFLQQHQLQLPSDFAEPADHLAVILAYGGHLTLNATESEQLQYLQSQLNIWLGQFVTQVVKTDPGDFYSALAQLTAAWVQSEIDWLLVSS
jgi:TorA-specific chaperone